MEEVELLSRRDAQEPVRLGDAACDLGEELGARDSDGDGDPDPLADVSAQALGDLAGRACDPAHPADVEERLVDGEALDERRGVLEDPVERLARLRIGGHAWRDDDRFGAETARPGSAHGRAHSVGLGLVARGEHDAPADDHWAAAEARVVPLLDRGKECIGVGVQDRRLVPHEHMFA